MSLLHFLEEKHFGRLIEQKVLQLASKDKAFAYQWFVHALRSEVSERELILCCAFALKWQVVTLEQVQILVNGISLSNDVQIDVETSALAEGIGDIDKQVLIDFTSTVGAIINWQGDQECYEDTAQTAETNLPLALFERVRQQIAPQLKDVTLFGSEGAGSQDQSIRNNSQFFTPLPNNSLELAIMERLTANMVGMPIGFAEPPVVLRYLPGQYYHWHYDHIYPHNQEIENQIQQFGQRVKTGILNLNDDFEGGETEFKLAKLSLKAKTGQIITFDNADADGNRLVKSIHRGAEVKSGEKWIMTLWFRDKPFWLRQGLWGASASE
ncbi:prolyl hydroxylase family protein [Thalassotalea euphylliae]|uniref:prolyl hydroxylase family protein n=1 Tax=Thalassotalea euphylliae TaxID=1655234 RepID=UPI003642F417